MCDMVWCYMWCHAMSDEVWNVVMRCGMMVWCMGNVVCCDARCEMCLWNTGWCAIVWRHIRHGVMRNDGWNPMWNVCCGIVGCVIYIWMWWCACCGARWNVGLMWNGALRCGGMIWRELLRYLYVKCGAMWNVAISDMVWCGMRLKCKTVWCGIWRGVDCGVLVCGMWQCKMWNVTTGCEMRLCGIMVMKNVAYAMCCAIVVWWQMWKMMQCVVMSDVVVWCDVEYGVVWNVLWCWMWV